MLVLTQSAYESFIEELNFCNRGDKSWRCAVLKFSLAKNKKENWFTTVAEKINTHFGNEGTIYLFSDDDIFVLSRYITKKGMDVLYESLHTIYEGIPQSLAVMLYELPVHLDFVREEADRKRPNESITFAQNDASSLKIFNPLLDPDYQNIVKTLPSRRLGRPKAEILVSEDDPFSSRLVCRTIDSRFFSYAAYDGEQTLQSYIFNAPDVLFLDIGLPDMNGLEILTNILDADPDAYIVMISANGSKENVLKAMEQGAKGFIAKPFTREKLFQYIEKCPSIRHKISKGLVN